MSFHGSFILRTLAQSDFLCDAGKIFTRLFHDIRTFAGVELPFGW